VLTAPPALHVSSAGVRSGASLVLNDLSAGAQQRTAVANDLSARARSG